jgi:hypothetical protein
MAILAMAGPCAAPAQETGGTAGAPPRASSSIDLSSAVTFEITPHTGIMGSSGVFGLKMLMTYSAFSLELAGEQVIGRTANLYPITVNALLNLSTRGRLIPYGTVGAGLWLTVPTGALGAQTVSTLGINFGGGARFFITRSFGLRLEVKQHVTTVSSDRDLKEELLIFQEVSLGVVFLFR